MIMALTIPVCFWFGWYAFTNPEKVWKFQHFLSVKDGTPTAFSLFMIKAGAIIIFLAGIFILFMYIDIILSMTIFK